MDDESDDETRGEKVYIINDAKMETIVDSSYGSSEIDDENEDETKKKKEYVNYDAKKPLWWKNLSNRRPTKGQRRAIASMTNYFVPHIKYGDFLDWDVILPNCQERWMELGFGQGENLLVNAQKFRNRAYVGAEIHSGGIGVACKRMKESIENRSYWTDFVPYNSKNSPKGEPCSSVEATIATNTTSSSNVASENSIYSNIRIYKGDGMKLIKSTPTSSVDAVLITFPDPFPKPSHEQLRLIQVNTVSEIYRVLTKKINKMSNYLGRLFLATDHDGYFEWCQFIFDQLNQEAAELLSSKTIGYDLADFDMIPRFRVVEPCPDRSYWLPVISKYEQKGFDEGRTTKVQCWEVWPCGC